MRRICLKKVFCSLSIVYKKIESRWNINNQYFNEICDSFSRLKSNKNSSIQREEIGNSLVIHTSNFLGSNVH